MFEKMDSSPKSGQYNPEYNLKPYKNKKVNYKKTTEVSKNKPKKHKPKIFLF